MSKFLTIHNETNIDRTLLESRWKEISMDPRAEWQMTLYGESLGQRFCEWDAPNRETIEEIFQGLGINWTEIVEVDVTSASEWRMWQLGSGRGKERCWEVTNCGRQPVAQSEGDTGFCPAAVDCRSNGRDGDLFTDRYCWKVVGTSCQEKVTGALPESFIESSNCPFFGNSAGKDQPRYEM